MKTGVWLPIETAPREYRQGGFSTRILLYCDRAWGKIFTGHWYEEEKVVDGQVAYRVEGWWLDGFNHPFNRPPFMPTHWMPLPDPPEGVEE